MPYTDAGKHLMLAALGAAITHASLHTADPTAGNEISGGSPAYEREAITWATPAAGQMEDGAEVYFDVPAGPTLTHVGFFSAATSGTLLAYGELPEPLAYAAQGTFTLTQALLDLLLEPAA